MNDDNTPILGFQGEYRFLSNFWHAPVHIVTGPFPEAGDKVTFEWNEQWFMVHKTLDPVEAALIMAATTPGECKRIGKTVTLRDDWESIKDQVMLDGLRMKFAQHKDLRTLLFKTGKRYLEETNRWGDVYWGVCDGVGRNMLGHLLMQVRSELTVA